MSDVDVGGIAVEVEPSCQYSFTFCCCVTDGSRGAVQQNGVWHGSAYEEKVCNLTEFLCAEKIALIDILWCLLNISGDQTMDVSTVRQWVVCFSNGGCNSGHLHWCSLQALIHYWKKYTANGGDYIKK